mmetsp:Transcript_5480/g.17738  ORF Transcript_5480/g.17738 Transcript_5480/m.17738 type:complete len:398 (+) Transcript_5480:605-1798(+)
MAMNETNLGQELYKVVTWKLGLNQHRVLLVKRQIPGTEESYEAFVGVTRVKSESRVGKTCLITVSTAHKLASERGVGHQQADSVGTWDDIMYLVKRPALLRQALQAHKLAVVNGNFVGAAAALLGIRLRDLGRDPTGGCVENARYTSSSVSAANGSVADGVARGQGEQAPPSSTTAAEFEAVVAKASADAQEGTSVGTVSRSQANSDAKDDAHFVELAKKVHVPLLKGLCEQLSLSPPSGATKETLQKLLLKFEGQPHHVRRLRHINELLAEKGKGQSVINTFYVDHFKPVDRADQLKSNLEGKKRIGRGDGANHVHTMHLIYALCVNAYSLYAENFAVHASATTKEGELTPRPPAIKEAFREMVTDLRGNLSRKRRSFGANGTPSTSPAAKKAKSR